MKRPLATAVTTLLVSQAAVFLLYIKARPWVILLVLAAAFLTALRWGEGDEKLLAKRAALMGVCALIGIANAQITIHKDAETFSALRGYEMTAQLRITQVQRRSRGVQVTADLLSADGKAYKGAEVSFFTAERVEVGDGVTAALATDLYAQNGEEAAVLFYCDDVRLLEVREGEHRLTFLLGRLRGFVQKSLTRHLAGTEGLFAAALLTGDKSILPADIRVQFTRTGLSHLLVVSGLHISVLLFSLQRLLSRLRLREGLRFAVFLVCGVFLALFYGLTPSVVRACVMSGMTAAASLFGRKTDGFTSLSVAALVILLIDPRSVQTLSFLLSYSCCFALVAVYPLVDGWAERHFEGCESLGASVLRLLAKSLCVTLTVTVVTLPVLLAAGLTVSFVAPLANLLVLWCMPLFLTFAVLTVLLGAAPFLWFFSSVSALACGALARFILGISETFGELPFVCVSTQLLLPAFRLAAAGICALVIAGFMRGRIRLEASVLRLLLLALACAAVALADAALCPNTVRFVQGEQMHLHTKCVHLVFAEQLSADDAAYLWGTLRSWMRGAPNCVILLQEPKTEACAALKAHMPDTEVIVLDETKSAVHRGEASVSLLADGTVLLEAGGAIVAVSAESTHVDADVCWFSLDAPMVGTFVPETDYILPGSIPHGTRNVYTYTRNDVVELRLCNETYKVVYR